MSSSIKDKFISVLGIIVGLWLMQACSPKVESEEACNFVQNSGSQRVSWENNAPMNLYIDSSIPASFYDSIDAAAEKWNQAAGRNLIQVVRSDVGSSSPAKDGYSKIYLMDSWDASMPNEQARTTVFWRGDNLYEADIRLNAKNFSFFVNSAVVQWDSVHLESLVLHELGHALGLAHNNSSQSVMQTSLSQGSIRNEVGQDDLSSLSCEYSN